MCICGHECWYQRKLGAWVPSVAGVSGDCQGPNVGAGDWTQTFYKSGTHLNFYVISPSPFSWVFLQRISMLWFYMCPQIIWWHSLQGVEFKTTHLDFCLLSHVIHSSKGRCSALRIVSISIGPFYEEVGHLPTDMLVSNVGSEFMTTVKSPGSYSLAWNADATSWESWSQKPLFLLFTDF